MEQPLTPKMVQGGRKCCKKTLALQELRNRCSRGWSGTRRIAVTWQVPEQEGSDRRADGLLKRSAVLL